MQESGLIEIIFLIRILISRAIILFFPFFSILIPLRVQLQWLMALRPQHLLFTEIAGDILCLHPHVRKTENGFRPGLLGSVASADLGTLYDCV